MKKFIVESVAQTNNVSIFYYVSFYPYTKKGEPQIFVTIGDTFVVIAACGADPTGRDKSIDIIATYADENPQESLCSACWTYDANTGRPLIAVGGKSGVVKIIDCASGKLVRVLKGHGDEILDLHTCPTQPHIIASSSGDHTIRVWNLDPKYKDQPCAIICAGGGHREQVLTVCFHDSGRFLVSGGMDNQVHLWALPDLSNLPMHKDDPIVLHWSHFSTNSLHSNYVDSVAFYGDLILSKAAKENKIVLWRIDGFRSEMADILSQDNAPTNHDKQRETMSAFGPGFTRLVQFSTPNTAPWYMRFGKLTGAATPLLAMGNDSARVYIFDLKSYELQKDATRTRSVDGNDDGGETGSTKSTENTGTENEQDTNRSISDSQEKKRSRGDFGWSVAKDLARRNKRRVQHPDKIRQMAATIRNGAASYMSEAGSVGTNEDDDQEEDEDDGHEHYLEANSNVEDSADDVELSESLYGQERRTDDDQNGDAEDEEDEVYDDAPDDYGSTKSASGLSNKESLQDIQIVQVSDEDSPDEDEESVEEDYEDDQSPAGAAELQGSKMVQNQSIISNTDGGIIELSSDSVDEEETISPPKIRTGLVVPDSVEPDDEEDEFDDDMEEENESDSDDEDVSKWNTTKQRTDIETSMKQSALTETVKQTNLKALSARKGVSKTRDKPATQQNGSMKDMRVKDAKRSRISVGEQKSEPLTLPSSQQKALSIAAGSSTPALKGDGTSAIADPFQSVRPQLTLDIPRSRRLVRHLAFSPHGDYLVAVGDGGVICVWRMQ
ncbi:WD40-repeat-containing domain protein [Lipomyces chichibuensis]|uniref:WD40-repeat-containing domain protein n=1 Tax=Lipomyces chichibuensis TaxID=1546026 RepID=UPI0033437A60